MGHRDLLVTQNLSDAKHHSYRPHLRGSVRRASDFVLTGYAEVTWPARKIHIYVHGSWRSATIGGSQGTTSGLEFRFLDFLLSDLCVWQGRPDLQHFS